MESSNSYQDSNAMIVVVWIGTTSVRDETRVEEEREVLSC